MAQGGRVALLPALLGACYVYQPVPAGLQPQQRVAVVLSDYGRFEASRQIGPQAMRVEGSIISSDDTAYLMSVSSVKPITGTWVRWSGEQVSMRRDYVAQMYERRFSKGRTALFSAAVTALFVLAVKTHLFGIGADQVPIVPPGGGGQNQ
jgi:hypothetical protein